jgi:purine-binding chemotaxis protein CheW
MAESAAARDRDDERRYLAFKAGERTYALPAEDVAEIVRVPALARVPQAPPSLLGLGNLRGRVTPVASLRALLGGIPDAPGGLALLLAGAAPVAIAIDGAPVLVSVDDLRTDDMARLARPEEHVVAMFSLGGDDVARVLDVQALLKQSFTPRATAAAKEGRGLVTGRSAGGRNDENSEAKFVSFMVAGQEFALELDAVREVIRAPDVVAPVPHAEELVIGVTAYRESLLPLISLRGLLGLDHGFTDGAKVVVSRIGGTLVGLVADQARAIVSVGEGESDPPPAVLAARSGAESQIKAIYRGDEGRRLVSILAPDQLFRGDVMQRLAKTQSVKAAEMESDQEMAASDRFLVFRLGDDEFALPIEAVIEVARVPEVITRVPKTPAFLEGVMSFRGEVLPVVDQRRRFDMKVREGDMSRRLIMVRSARHRAALIVDSVSEVLSHPTGEMDPAPDLTGDQTRLVLGVINLEEAARMVMVLDPAELLSRAERGLLDAFAPELPPAQ